MTWERNTKLTTNGIASKQAGRANTLAMVFVVTVVVTLVVAWVLVQMFGRKQEGREPFVRVVEVNELSTDPTPWGMNWPHHYDGYVGTAGDKFYGGSSALPESKLDEYPWLRRLYAGYAFSIDYREARGHAYMLYDQGVTERVTKKPQAGACLHCHGSTNVLYRKVGLEAMGQPADDATLAASFNMDAMTRGFQELSQRSYQEVLGLLGSMPDGTPEDSESPFSTAPAGGFTGEYAGKKLPADHQSLGDVHPVGCVDCHDPNTMAIRVTRPGFVLAMAELAAGDGEVPHLPSVETWRRGDREVAYDPNRDASRQEMRSFTCGQCHVEYYCANKDVLSFPWKHGLAMEDEERVWEEKVFPDGGKFYDYLHGETEAPVFKVQHPEFELWSQGIHARSGVSCADCHMPYERRGAMKLSNHQVQSPLKNLNNACQVCHKQSEGDLRGRVETIQERTLALMQRAATAMTDMLDAILEAKADGAGADELKEVFDLQRRAMWRLDYISSENSRGFHAAQEAARILGESIDYSRRAQALALRLRTSGVPNTASLPRLPVLGISESRNSGQ